MLDDPVINRIADARGKSPAQVVLRWHIQRGDIVFPKSVTPERVKSNFELFDFELDDSDMDAISALDKGESGTQRPQPGHVRLRAPLTDAADVAARRLSAGSAGLAFDAHAAPQREAANVHRRRTGSALAEDAAVEAAITPRPCISTLTSGGSKMFCTPMIEIAWMSTSVEVKSA